MNNINKYIWIMIVVVFTEWILKVYVEAIYDWNQSDKDTYATWASSLLVYGFLENIAAAFWLHSEVKKVNAHKFTWMAFALVFGIWAVAIYYLKVIFESRISIDGNNSPD